MGKDKYGGTFRDFFSQEDIKEPKRTPKDDRLKDMSDLAKVVNTFSNKIRKQYDGPGKPERLMAELFGSGTAKSSNNQAFLVSASALFDVMDMLDIDVSDYDGEVIQAAMMIIWAYVKEAKREK